MDYRVLSSKIESNAPNLVESVMQCIYEESFEKLKGSERIEKSRRDLKYIYNYLSEAVYFDNKEIFEDFSSWLNNLFKNIGLEEKTFIKTYRCIIDKNQEYFDKKEEKYLNNIIEDSIAFVVNTQKETKSFIDKNNHHSGYAKRYLELLLDSKKRKARQLIIDDALNNMGVDEIYLDIFQPVQQEVGRLWHLNEVSVAQEHYISSVTQLIMSQLYPHFLSMGGKKGNIVTTAVGNELHEIGIRMVADLLEVDGYDTIHLGANTPDFSIVETLENNNTKLIGISVTLPIHLKKLDNLVKSIRKNDSLNNIKIIVGGYAFNKQPNLYQQFDVDDYSVNARDAVKKINKLTGVVS